MIQAGRLKTPLEVQSSSNAADGLGGFTTTWSTIGTVWAEMWAIKGSERNAVSTVEATISHRIRLWAFPGLTTAHRLKLGTRTFNIAFINDVEMKGSEYVLDVLEIVGRAAR